MTPTRFWMRFFMTVAVSASLVSFGAMALLPDVPTWLQAAVIAVVSGLVLLLLLRYVERTRGDF